MFKIIRCDIPIQYFNANLVLVFVVVYQTYKTEIARFLLFQFNIMFFPEIHNRSDVWKISYSYIYTLKLV